MSKNLVRLDKLLGNRGLGTRGAIKKLISSKQVELEDGTLLKSSTEKIDESSVLIVQGKPSYPISTLVAWFKPKGVLSTLSDPLGRATILDFIPEQWRNVLCNKILHPVGRLDQDTTGLLLFSKDGVLSNDILNPDVHLEKEYDAIVEVSPESSMTEEELRELLKDGVELSDGPCSGELVFWKDNCMRLCITEGRHRVVRRLLNNSGYPVVELHRRRIGSIQIDELGLREGELCNVPNELLDKLLQDIESGKRKGEENEYSRMRREYHKDLRRTKRMFSDLFD